MKVKKEIKKPEKLSISYYDWHDVENFLGWSDSKTTKVWHHIIETTDDSMNGRIFTISDWELKHNNGEFKRLIPKWYIPVIEELMEHFGEVDDKCLTPNTKTANFRSNW